MMTDDDLAECLRLGTMGEDSDYPAMRKYLCDLYYELLRSREKVAELHAEVNRLQVIVNRITGPVGGIG